MRAYLTFVFVSCVLIPREAYTQQVSEADRIGYAETLFHGFRLFLLSDHPSNDELRRQSAAEAASPEFRVAQTRMRIGMSNDMLQRIPDYLISAGALAAGESLLSQISRLQSDQELARLTELFLIHADTMRHLQVPRDFLAQHAAIYTAYQKAFELNDHDMDQRVGAFWNQEKAISYWSDVFDRINQEANRLNEYLAGGNRLDATTMYEAHILRNIANYLDHQHGRGPMQKEALISLDTLEGQVYAAGLKLFIAGD